MALYRIDGYNNEKAQKIGQELEALGDNFTPNDVVELARNGHSAMHKEFIWDDRKAGHEYRLHQARSLLQKVKIVIKVKDNNEITRAFHNVRVRVNKKVENRYVTLRVVKKSNNFSYQVIEQAKRELEHWSDRYKQYSQLFGGTEVFEDIERAVSSLDKAFKRAQKEAEL